MVRSKIKPPITIGVIQANHRQSPKLVTGAPWEHMATQAATLEYLWHRACRGSMLLYVRAFARRARPEAKGKIPRTTVEGPASNGTLVKYPIGKDQRRTTHNL